MTVAAFAAANRLPLRQWLPFNIDAGKNLVSANNRLGQQVGMERLANPAFSVIKVNREMHPPRAIVAPEMVGHIVSVDPN